jgi:hypothetical protein
MPGTSNRAPISEQTAQDIIANKPTLIRFSMFTFLPSPRRGPVFH